MKFGLAPKFLCAAEIVGRRTGYPCTLDDKDLGRVPTQIDYQDYRAVNGVKIPFQGTMTWTDGRETIELTNVQMNAAIPAARFAKPQPPTPQARRASQ